MEYLINTQKDEIDRLDSLVKAEEEKLDLAEQCLEQDAALFDEFLKNNDKASVEAVTAAESEARLRSELGHEVKRLTLQEQQHLAEIHRLQRLLKEYKSYREFLEKIIPDTQRAERERLRQNRRRTRKRVREEANRIELSTIRSTLRQHSTCSSAPSSQSETSPQRLSFVSRRRSSVRPLRTKRNSPTTSTARTVEEVPSSSDDSGDEVYFSDPKEVLQMLFDLEEANLRLIQHCQETEDTIDTMASQTRDTTDRLESDAAVLEKHYSHLQQGIYREEDKAMGLSIDVSDFTFAGYAKEEQPDILEQVQAHIAEVYRKCTHKDEASLESLQMLAEIESRLVEVIQLMLSCPLESLRISMDKREKAHRVRVKTERKLEEQRLQEERRRKAIARAEAEPRKTTGRTVVQRSVPPRVVKKETEKSEAQIREEEEMAFLLS